MSAKLIRKTKPNNKQTKEPSMKKTNCFVAPED